MIFAAILGPPPYCHVTCAMTLSSIDGARYWASAPRLLSSHDGAALVDYLAAGARTRKATFSFGGHRALLSISALMRLGGDEDRAAAAFRMAHMAHDIYKYSPTTLAMLLAGGPGPCYPESVPTIVDWLLNPSLLWDNLAAQIACVAFIVRSCTPAGAVAFIAAGGTTAKLNSWRAIMARR